MNQNELFTRIDKLLWEEWDPIGVRDYGGPDDEYRGYVPIIVALLAEGASELQIAEQLYKIATVAMGLSSSLSDHLEMANELKRLS